jgi:hypothetical protein
VRSSLRPRFTGIAAKTPKGGKMKSSQEWRDTAVRLRERSDEFQRKAEALEHASNLLLNNGLVAFDTDMTQDGTIHDFLFRVASIENPFRRMLSGGNRPCFGCLWERNRMSSLLCSIFVETVHRFEAP